MECTSHSPSYLVRNAHSYCFRLIVPKDLKKFVGKTELRYTLGTGYLGIAKKKSRFLAGQVQFIFQVLRKGFMGMGTLSENQIQELVGQYIKNSIDGLDGMFGGADEKSRPYDDPPSLFSYIKGLNAIREDLIVSLNLGDFSMLEDSVGKFLKVNGIDEVDKASPEYRKLCIEIHKAETKLIPIQQQHLRCDFSYKGELPKIFPEVYPARDDTPPKTKEKKKAIPISKVLKDYWDEKKKDLKPRSIPEFRRVFDHFIGFIGGNTDIQEVDSESLKSYKKKLMKEAGRKGKTKTSKTVNKYLGFLKGLFTYSKDNMGIPDEAGHRFRSKAATDSDRFRPPIPTQGGHPVLTHSRS